VPRTPISARRRAASQAASRLSKTGKFAEFDNDAFVTALDATRVSRSMTWKQVADESGVSASTLTRMAQGKRPDVDGLAALLAWSGLDATRFVRHRRGSPREPEPLARVATYFRRDPNLTRESAIALEELVKATYDRLRER